MELKLKSELDLGTNQKLALCTLQKQKQILELKEWLIMAGFVFSASILRVPMQVFPNVEPLTFFALLTGWLFGKKKGFLVGVSSLYLSNFMVFGGQGPWTIYQAIGFGVVGFLGGFLRKKAGILETVTLAFISTMFLQFLFNIGWSLTFGFNIILTMITGFIFAIVHVVSNVAFATMLPKAKKLIYEKGGFDEKELCNAYIKTFTKLSKKSKT